MSKRIKPKEDKEILGILEDYHLFIDCDKHVDMHFLVNEVDRNHITSLMGKSELTAVKPLGNTVLECEMRMQNEFDYSFKLEFARLCVRLAQSFASFLVKQKGRKELIKTNKTLVISINPI